MMNKKLLFGFLAAVIFIAGIVVGAIGSWLWMSPFLIDISDWQPRIEKVFLWQPKIEKILLWENGEVNLLAMKGSSLRNDLSKILLRSSCMGSCVINGEELGSVWPETALDIKKNNKVIEVIFSSLEDVPTIESLHPGVEKGYGCFPPTQVKVVLFVLEDSEKYKLRGNILLGQANLIPGDPNIKIEEIPTYYCRAIIKNEKIDKTWIEEIAD